MISKLKYTLLTILLAAFVAQPALASPLNNDDMAFAFGDSSSVSSDLGEMALLSDQEMKDTEGNWWFIALPLARAAIWALPRISSSYRVIRNTRSAHTILLRNNVHRVHIGTDRWGRHVGWGANSRNRARWHIYRNNPWRINPY